MELVRGLHADHFRDRLHDGGPSVLVGLIGTVSSRRRLAAFGERGRRSRRHYRRREPLLVRRGFVLPRILAARQDAIPAAANLAAAWDGPSQTQNRPCTLGASESRTGRLAGVRTAACAVREHWSTGPGSPRARAAQRPYQFNCTFTAWHPETGERRGANRSGQAARQLPPSTRGRAATCRPGSLWRGAPGELDHVGKLLTGGHSPCMRFVSAV